MRYGLLIDSNQPVPDVISAVQRVADAGIDMVGVSQVFGYDALTLLAVVGREVPHVELLTAVVPTYPRHPIMLAGQALTVQAAIGSPRLTLGIGLSHRVVIEGVYGLSFDRPARHMRDYLHVLMPLLHGDGAAYEGETIKVATGPLQIQAPPPDVLVAALAPVMLALAGTLADGTATWMTGPRTIGEHIVPSITAAAAEAGRKPPRVSVGLPVCVTEDVEAARERAGQAFSVYGRLPVYRAVLDREGVDGPGDVAIVGDEESVARHIRALEDIGGTEFLAAPFGSRQTRERTVALIADLAKKQAHSPRPGRTGGGEVYRAHDTTKPLTCGTGALRSWGAVLLTLATRHCARCQKESAMAIARPPSWDEVAREAESAPSAWRESVRVVWLSGEQDLSTAGGLAERLANAVALGEGDLVVDMSQVQFMDVAIVRVFIHYHDLLGLQSRHLRLRAPSRFVRRILDLCGLVALIEPAPTVATGGNGSYVAQRGPG